MKVMEAHWNYELKGMKAPATAVPHNQRKDIQIGGLETVVTSVSAESFELYLGQVLDKEIGLDTQTASKFVKQQEKYDCK